MCVCECVCEIIWCPPHPNPKKLDTGTGKTRRRAANLNFATQQTLSCTNGDIYSTGLIFKSHRPTHGCADRHFKDLFFGTELLHLLVFDSYVSLHLLYLRIPSQNYAHCRFPPDIHFPLISNLSFIAPNCSILLILLLFHSKSFQLVVSRNHLLDS